MRVDGGVSSDLRSVPEQARRAEAAGYAAVWSAETGHDPLFPLLVAAQHTERLQLGTGIVVAFGRSPMTLAASAWDLNGYSGGRLLLGLGSQIKPHIEKRYSMPWSHPAARMHEFIRAMRAIWDCWQNRTKLDFRGDFYTHTLMTPFFDPGPSEHGAPKVYLAAVGPAMTKVAGEVADGMLVHGFTTERYLREVTLPSIESGLEAGRRKPSEFELSYPAFVVTGANDEEVEAAEAGTRRQIAFYGSTPAYRPVLELHGWGGLQDELNALSKRGEWDEMGRRIPDEVLDAFAVRGSPDEVAAEVHRRFGDVIDRVSLYMPYAPGGSTARVMEALAAV